MNKEIKIYIERKLNGMDETLNHEFQLMEELSMEVDQEIDEVNQRVRANIHRAMNTMKRIDQTMSIQYTNRIEYYGKKNKREEEEKKKKKEKSNHQKEI
mmetsp:Transcript_7071/g.10402  ORF Transcript_7071/g.10402 Transcript_7071/m.10402 type:complete len:99 (+) Transcript_7071:57-353(+)